MSGHEHAPAHHEDPAAAHHEAHEAPVSVADEHAAELTEELLGDEAAPHEGEPTAKNFADALHDALNAIHVPADVITKVVAVALGAGSVAKALLAASVKLSELAVDFDVEAFAKKAGFFKDEAPAKPVDLPEHGHKGGHGHGAKTVDKVVGETQAAIYRSKLAAACAAKLGAQAEILKTTQFIGEGPQDVQAYEWAVTKLAEVFLRETVDTSVIDNAGSEAARAYRTEQCNEEAKRLARAYLQDHGAGPVEA